MQLLFQEFFVSLLLVFNTKEASNDSSNRSLFFKHFTNLVYTFNVLESDENIIDFLNSMTFCYDSDCLAGFLLGINKLLEAIFLSIVNVV